MKKTTPSENGNLPRRKHRHSFWRGMLFLILLLPVAVVAAFYLFTARVEAMMKDSLYQIWPNGNFSFESLIFSPLEQRFSMIGCRWGNPPGYERSRNAVTIGSITVNLDLSGLRHKKLHFTKIEINDMEFNLEFKNTSFALLNLGTMMMLEPEPKNNLYNAFYPGFYHPAPGHASENSLSGTFLQDWTLEIDTLAIGAATVRLSNLSDIPGSNLFVNLKEQLALTAPPYTFTELGKDRSIGILALLQEITDTYYRQVGNALQPGLKKLLPNFIVQLPNSFSADYRNVKKCFQDIRSWEDLENAVILWERLKEFSPTDYQAIREFLEDYPYTLAIAPQILQLKKSRENKQYTSDDTDAIKREEENLKESSAACQAIREWKSKELELLDIRTWF